MSDNRWLSLPTGRRLETPDYDTPHVGTVGVLRKPDEASLRLARRNMREIPEKNIEGQGLHLVERSTGETWEVITSLVDLVDPRASGVVAFTIRDSLLVPLRPIGWKSDADKSVEAGEIYGREATGREPMPMPTGAVVY
jgi:hypothetical protein